MHYAPDQSSTYDVLLSRDQNASIDVSDKVTAGFLSADPKGASVNLSLDTESYVADAQITNSRPDYRFGSYSLLVPDGYGGEDATILLLQPNETIHRYHGLNHSLFQQGFVYTIPISASFDDAKDQKTFGVGGASPSAQTSVPPSPCAAAA